jgi:hypothetical protein
VKTDQTLLHNQGFFLSNFCYIIFVLFLLFFTYQFNYAFKDEDEQASPSIKPKVKAKTKKEKDAPRRPSFGADGNRLYLSQICDQLAETQMFCHV